MNAITYTATATNVPGLVQDLHLRYPFGYAYETPSHFVHFYGSADFGIHIGMTVTQIKNGTLKDWVQRVFGASNIFSMVQEPGETIERVWRPSLSPTDIFQALNISDGERRLTNQAIRVLLERLDELFLYIEPDLTGLATYSLKTRELLILACTEVENFWKLYMDNSNLVQHNGKYTTNNYIKLAEKLFLKNYTFTVRTYSSIPRLQPFLNWDSTNPTGSLPWYDGYNKTKHDRSGSLSSATLLNCINAVVANLIMYCVRYSPVPLFEDLNALSVIMNQHFIMELITPARELFYLYKVELPANIGTSLTYLNPKESGFIIPFTSRSLLL